MTPEEIKRNPEKTDWVRKRNGLLRCVIYPLATWIIAAFGIYYQWKNSQAFASYNHFQKHAAIGFSIVFAEMIACIAFWNGMAAEIYLENSSGRKVFE